MSGFGRWSVAGLFVAFVGWELVAALDGSQGTWPLTQVITTYVPWPVTAAAIVVFCPWVAWHFWT